MKRIVAIVLLVVLSACVPEENEGGTPLPNQGSGAPLNDEAVGPSEQQTEADE